MDFLAIISIIIIIIFFILLLFLISNRDNNYNNYNNQLSNNNNIYNNFNQNSNDIQPTKIDDDLLKSNIQGYENELMSENELKGGDYVKQFKEIDFSQIPKSNNQIGFNPQPRDSSEIKLPYADINVNCL